MPDKLNTESSFYSASYQSFDGSNYTTVGFEEKLKFNNKYISVYTGAGTDFKSDNLDWVIDFKGGMNYDKAGKFNQNLRLRTKLGEGKQSVQLRYSPLSINVPVGEKTSLYANPHGVVQYSSGNKLSTSAGIFAGGTQKLGENTAISLEVQRYNLQDIKDNSGKNWSVNAILTYKF